MKQTTRNIPAKTRKMVAEQLAVAEIHPAQKAGAAVHQAVENGVNNVAEAATTAGQYVFGFFKGLVKGH